MCRCRVQNPYGLGEETPQSFCSDSSGVEALARRQPLESVTRVIIITLI